MVASVLLPGQRCLKSCCSSLEDGLIDAPAQAMTAKAEAKPKPEVTLAEACAWLKSYQLLEDGTTDEAVLQRHKELSKCKFGTGVDDVAKGRFLRRLILHEQHLAAKQTDIGNVRDPKYHY